MSRNYFITGNFTYEGQADTAGILDFLKENIEEVEMTEGNLKCWGDSYNTFPMDLLGKLFEAGDLATANIDVKDEEVYTRYAWDKDQKAWWVIFGEMVYNTDEAEAKFGKSTAHKALADMFAAYVNNDFDGCCDRNYCRDALLASGCTKEIAEELGLGYIFDEDEEN